MDWENVSVKLKSLSRRAGIARVPLPVLACVAVACIVLVVFALVRFFPAGTPANQDFEAPAQVEEQTADEQGADVQQVGVDVEGAVASPGLYLVSADARVNDAVAAAGGMTKEADRQRVNLAQKVEDGMQVYVPSREEASTASGVAATGTGQASSPGSSKGKVNLNTASAEELQTLSGIGPSLSQRIIDYRQANGPFKSVEDLRKVSGIGDTRFKSLKDLVCV